MNFKHLVFTAALGSSLAFADAKVDAKAPDFKVTDAAGGTKSLADAAGKWLVLEWTNKDCPYVKKHYGAGNMQALQKKYVSKGVVWYTVNSGAKGKQGYLNAADTLAHAKEVGAASSAYLLDSDGKMGKAYGAKTTPHMYVIDPKGTLVYAGAIDDNDSSDPGIIPNSKNYVNEALSAAMEGKAITTKSSKPYGCGVKYGS